jgi:hypothetical protein
MGSNWKRWVASLALLGWMATPGSGLDCRHGFWIFGNRHIYISHKPEIGSPCHGFQVILEVELEGSQAQEVYHKLEAKKGEMTVEFPQHFLLEDVTEGAPLPVLATLYDGNYEDQKHPHPIVRLGIRVHVVRKVVFRPLTNEGQEGVVNAFVFGTPEELFLANRVDRDPDFDQVLEIKTSHPERYLGEVAAYPIPAHHFAPGGKPDCSLKAGETTEFLDGESKQQFRVLRKVELTMSQDAFAASH